MRSKESWLVEKNRATVKPDSSVEWKLTAKAELNCEIYKSWRKCWKTKSVFVIEAALWAEELGRCLENYRSWKKYPRKTCGYGQPGGQFIRVLNERSVNDEGDSCLLGWWFSKQLDIVSETHFSCDTVDRGLWLAILSSLLCHETDRNIRIGKQGYVLYFTDFKTWCFAVSFLTAIGVSTVVLTVGKVLFLKIN